MNRAALRELVANGPPAIFATISGAHLYGFESEDSDVDLRGVFVAPLDDMIGLREPRETMTLMEQRDGTELDWVAHDVRKFARLMTRRNGYVMEQLYSPLVVVTGPWHDELKAIGAGFLVSHHYHHYRGFARNQRELASGNEPTVKRLLYTYRVLLTGIHLLTTGRVEANLGDLLEAHPLDGVADLIERKRGGGEDGTLASGEFERHASRLDALDAELATAFDSSSLPEEAPPLDELDDFVVRARRALGDAAPR